VVKYDFHLNLFATGTEDGEIALWDYERSSLQAYLLGHEEKIVAIEFLSPRPLMLSAGADGKICIWTTRPVPLERIHTCIFLFVNRNITLAGHLEVLTSQEITAVAILASPLLDMEQTRRLKP
jgi:WD40 repeat protein